MQAQYTTIPPPGATRARFRGWLYMAQHGPDDAIRGATVCVDYLMACLALAGWPEGDVWLVAPDEGKPLRRYLAGSPAPLGCAMRRETENIVAKVARVAAVSKTTALLAVEAVLRDRGGVGWTLYVARNRIQGGAKIMRFDAPPGAAP